MKKISEDSVIKVYELNDTSEIEDILNDKNWLQFKIMGYELIVEEIVKEESFNEKLNKIISRPQYVTTQDIQMLFEGGKIKNSTSYINSDDIKVRDETIKCLNKEIEDLKNEVERWSGKYKVKHLECADAMISLEGMTNDRNKLWSRNKYLEEINKELKQKLDQKNIISKDIEKAFDDIVKQRDEKDEINKELNLCLNFKEEEINKIKDEVEKLRKHYPKEKMIREVKIVDDLIRQSEYVSELRIKDINKHQTMIQITLNK